MKNLHSQINGITIVYFATTQLVLFICLCATSGTEAFSGRFHAPSIFKPTLRPTYLSVHTTSILSFARTEQASSRAIRLFSTSTENENFRFLGKGKNAIVREGAVLVAPSHEFNHFLMRAAIFIYSVGIDEYGENVARGVIIDHPTAFTIGEMGAVYGVLGNNMLYRGGDKGKDSAMMLHSCDKLGSDMIGTSGIYEGGLEVAMNAADNGEISGDDVKFFFNYVEFTEQTLEEMLAITSSENDFEDAWFSAEVPSSLILDDDLDRGQAWKHLRNQFKQWKERQEEDNLPHFQ